MIVTADWHISEPAKDAYRWDIFSALRRRLQEHGPDNIYVLGDVTDRADRHSAVLVNQLVAELQSLIQCGATGVHIIQGNHDAPLRGVPYWEILNALGHGIHYYDTPTPQGRLILLPWTPDPVNEWMGLDLSQFDAAFLHMTVPGAMMESGIRARGGSNFIFPKHLKLYSGDIHTPQNVGVIYVGAPHPVKFGDTYPCRVLVLDGDFSIAGEITLNPPRKLVLEVSDLHELATVDVSDGDQVRVKLLLPPGGVAGWQEQQAGIMAWAAEAGVSITSLEAVVALGERGASLSNGDTDPVSILTSFAAAEGLSDEIMQVGLNLIAEVRGEVG